MISLSVTLGDIASIVVIVASVTGFGWWLNRKLVRHEREHAAATALLSLLVSEASERDPKFKTKIDGFNALLTVWERRHAEAGNPITPTQALRRQTLTGQLQAGQTLPYADLLELQRILQEELEDAQRTNAELAVVIALLVILGLVVVAIALAARGS